MTKEKGRWKTISVHADVYEKLKEIGKPLRWSNTTTVAQLVANWKPKALKSKK